MTNFEQEKIIQVVLYILNRTGGIDYYHVFKIIYFAEMKHLAKWGHRILSDEMRAIDYGPVPTKLYDAVKGKNAPQTRLADLLREAIAFAGEDAPNVLLAKGPADMDYISASEAEALDESIAENANLTFGQLKEKSHDRAWREAFQRKNGTNKISAVSMARVMHADEATLNYIQEQEEIEEALLCSNY